MGQMINKILHWLYSLFDSRLVHLAIVRRYTDANGNFVGELYMYNTFAGIGSYRLAGCSLDSLAFDLTSLSLADEPRTLDLEHDFLEPMQANTLRVGAIEPGYNDLVRQMIGRLKRKNIRLVIQNKFIEHILEPKKI
jgi:hypothetical protein